MISAAKLPATRWGAFFSHLLISLGLLIALSALIAFVMFPGALFSAAGGIEGIKIIAGVDMVLGPLLTLVIYNRAKPSTELFRDLSIIGLIQLAALSYGMIIVHKSRPAAVTYAFDQFYTTKANEFDTEDSERPENLKLFTPAFFNVRLPTDNQEARNNMGEYELFGPSPRLNTKLYEPLKRELEPLETQLRLSINGTDESIDQTCLVRTLVTAFDTVDVCFDPKTFRLYKQKGPAN